MTLRGVGPLDPGTVVIDVGGGSTELITESFRTSMDIGSVRLTERFGVHQGRRGRATSGRSFPTLAAERALGVDGTTAELAGLAGSRHGDARARSTRRSSGSPSSTEEERRARLIAPGSQRGARRRRADPARDAAGTSGSTRSTASDARPAERRRAGSGRASRARRRRRAPGRLYVLLRVALTALAVLAAGRVRRRLEEAGRCHRRPTCRRVAASPRSTRSSRTFLARPQPRAGRKLRGLRDLRVRRPEVRRPQARRGARPPPAALAPAARRAA